MVDTSKQQGFAGKVDFVFSQASVVSKSALLLGGLSGAYLANLYLGLPFYLGAFVALLAFAFLLIFMAEDERVKSFSLIGSLRKIKTIAKDSIQYSANHKVISWLLVGGILGTLISQPMNMFWAPKFNEMAGDKIWLTGWFWAFISLFMILGSYSVKIFLKRGKDYAFLMILASLGIFLPIVLSAQSKILFVAFPMFLIYELTRGVQGPVELAYINKYAESEKRATILSFKSMARSLGAAAGLVIFGWIAKNTSIEVSWTIAGILSLALIPVYLTARKKEGLYS